MYPRRSSTTHTEQLAEEVSVYDSARAQVHALNPTAARVWQQCDGATSPAAIAAVLRVEMGIPEAEAVVDLTLTQLARVHLLELPVEPRGDRSAPTRRWLLSRGLAAAMLPAIYSIVAPSPAAAQSVPPPPTGSAPFAFTGDVQTFTVPAGVTTLTVTARGAQGGSGGVAGNGGLGGSVTATITVVPNAIVNVRVGGKGANQNPFSGAGGFNGGGDGGQTFFAGGGGGASDLRIGGDALSNRVIVAAGGGGGGSPGAAGAGGGLDGGVGAPSTEPTVTGGGGGTQSAGGLGGVNPASPGLSGQPGAAGAGGAGGAPFLAGGLGGGGGGGGYFGGGGGAVAPAAGPLSPSGAAGGGGSSFADPAATGVAHVQGIQAGDGQVTISW